MTVDSNFTTETPVPPTNEQPVAPEAPVAQYTDGYSYEVPRPFLTLAQAAAVLGKSLRTIERSLSGRWGAKLPEGWVARKLRTENGDEWRILPPPGFRVKFSDAPSPGSVQEPGITFDTTPSPSLPMKRHTLDHPAIVIERTEEVESLLRDLVAAQRALAEERRVHLEDLRMISQLQSSMRLLETSANEQTKLKAELEAAKSELNEWREKYQTIVASPWWKRLFQRRQ